MSNLPSILVLVISFSAIIVLMKLKVPLYVGIAVGVLIVALLSSMTLGDTVHSLYTTILSTETISLVLIVLLITLFSSQLDASGRLKNMVTKARQVIKSRRLRLASFPALLGLLPMPGGAYFSAPMVGEAGKDLHLSSSQLTAINYWFRHIWEFWWPMYPGVLLAVSLTKVSLPSFIAVSIPLTVVAVLAGILTMFKGLGKRTSEKLLGNSPELTNSATVEVPTGLERSRSFLRELAPLLIVVTGGVAVETLREFLVGKGYGIFPQIPRLGIGLTLLLAVIWALFRERESFPQALKSWAARGNIEILLALISAMWYKEILTASGLVANAVEEMTSVKFSLMVIMFLLPFVAGIITGINVAAVGMSFPIVVGLAEGAGMSGLPVAVLGYASAHMGVMMSPIHFCLILSRGYFKSDYGRVYGLVMPSIFAVLVFAWGIAAAVSR